MAATLTSVTSRRLTDIFVLMRNNSLQSKHIFHDQGLDDKAALVSSRDIECGQSFSRSLDVPPLWVEGIEDIQYEMSRIKNKLQELTSLYDKHLNRPSFDDAIQEEQEIESLSLEITRMFHHCKKIIQQIRETSCGTTDRENQIRRNVLSSLVSSMQDLSTIFYTAQSNNLKKLRSREEKTQQFFDNTGFNPKQSTSIFDYSQEDSFNQSFLSAVPNQQQIMVEQNTFMVEQREREIKNIVKSLSDLNVIFSDLAVMIADQGTVLDRIDYNLEKVQTEVHGGLKQLQKAEHYHKKNRKMVLIFGLSATVIFMIILLVILKS